MANNFKTLEWQSAPSSGYDLVLRTPIFGGWLVKIVDPHSGEAKSITFVPDPEHKWDLKTDYSPKEPRMYL